MAPLQHRIDAFDGLRGFSVAIVFLAHTLGFPVGGGTGVDLFFVMSGYFITSILCREWDRRRSINLKHFYINRTARLLPGIFALCGLYGLIWWIFPGATSNPWGNLLSTVFVWSNWARAVGLPYPDVLGHTWSLSIEWQFYFVWPFVFIALRQMRMSLRSVSIFLVSLIGAVWINRYLMSDNGAWVYNASDTRCDGLLFGCLIAMILNEKSLMPSKWLTALGAVSAVGLAYVILYAVTYPWYYALGFNLANLSSAGVVLYLASDRNWLTRFALENRVMVWLGRRSYGIYLYHFPLVGAMWASGYTPFQMFTVGLLVTLTLAELSWRFVESPCLRLKDQWSRGERMRRTPLSAGAARR